MLKPLDKLEGIREGQAIVFCVKTDEGGNSFLCVEEDEKIATEGFDDYLEFVKEVQ